MPVPSTLFIKLQGFLNINREQASYFLPLLSFFPKIKSYGRIEAYLNSLPIYLCREVRFYLGPMPLRFGNGEGMVLVTVATHW